MSHHPGSAHNGYGHDGSPPSEVNGYTNGHAGGPSDLARRAQFGLHDEDTDDSDEQTAETSARVEVNQRHGFDYAESVLAEEEQLRTSTWLPWTDCNRFEKVPRMTEPLSPAFPEWRHPRDRLRTSQGALVVCLRLGYDPPDVVKTEPCARTEAWVDPALLVREKAVEQIGKNLVKQYENLATTGRVRYKSYMDSVVEEVKKVATSTRRLARGDRVLFHYNGHGVPKPTPSGEIWLFNRAYTQYIPTTLLDLITWVGSPAIYVWDCSAAGNIVNKVVEFAKRKDEEVARAEARDGAAHEEAGQAHYPYSETIQLAACQAHQSLPMNPDLPADLFTSCLTSPIEMALTFFILRNPLKAGLSPKLAFQIPGKQTDRKSALGELSWIFTAVTDTIAWNTFPPSLFQRLFRHDLVVAALSRGFLLAERIMRHYDCTPVSVPALPATHNHPLWDSWDLAVDRCLSQLPAILAADAARSDAMEAGRPLPPEVIFQSSRFFSDELQAFELWLEQGIARAVAPADVATTPASPIMPPTDGTTRRHAVHPQQLPIVLQVLLSQAHRTRALVGLCKFLDLGPWAVNLGLSIGIFPYVLKLLQAPTADLKPLLIFIWARILGVFRSCQDDLLRIAGPPPPGRQIEAPFLYFVRALNPASNVLLIPNVSEHRAMCAFILSILCRDHQSGQAACLEFDVLNLCLLHLEDVDPLLRQWSALCIAQLWNEFDEAKGAGINKSAHEKLSLKLTDEVPEVRAAVLYALASLIGAPAGEKTRADARSLSGARTVRTQLSAGDQVDIELGVAMASLKLVIDGSPQVRRELVVLLSAIVVDWEGHILVAAYNSYDEDKARQTTGRPSSHAAEERQRFIEQTGARVIANGEGEDASASPAFRSMMFSCIYKILLDLASDPYPSVSEHACVVVDFIHERLLQSPLAYAQDSVLPTPNEATGEMRLSASLGSRPNGGASGTSTQGSTLKRGGSFAAAAVKTMTHLSGFTESTPTSPVTTTASQSSRGGVRSARDLRGSSSVDNIYQAAQRASSSAISNDDAEKMSIEDAKLLLLETDNERMQNNAATATAPPSLSSGTSTPLASISKDSLPLRSEFFDYCCRYFTEPQMKAPEAEEPGSAQYNARLWRRDRAERIVNDAQAQREKAGSTAWDYQTGSYSGEAASTQVILHQFEPHMAVSDTRGYVSTYHLDKHMRLSRFHIEAPSERNGVRVQPIKVSTLKFINEEDVAFLLTGSSDGSIRIFRNYESRDVELVTAFRALTDITPSTIQEAGLTAEWQQTRGHLLIGGNVRNIRVWDAGKDAVVQDIPTRAGSCLTSMTSDQVAGNIVVGAFGDGLVRVYDRRKPPRSAMSMVWKGHHRGWVQTVHMQRGGSRELVSGSVDGTVCLWDVRQAAPLRITQAHQGGMTGLAVHDHAPVFATGTVEQVVKMWSMDHPESISSFRNGTSYLQMSQRSVPICTMAFHPHRQLLVTGSGDGHLNLYEPTSNRK